MSRRSPVNRRDPSGTRRIERREIARQGRIIDTYAHAMARVASGIEEGVSTPKYPASQTQAARNEKLERLRDAMREDLLASTDDWINQTSQAAAASTDRVLNNMHAGIKLGNVPIPAEEVSILRANIQANVGTISDKMYKETLRLLTEGYQQGLSADKIARQVEEAGGATRSDAERIVRTETMRVCDVVGEARYKAAGCDGYMSYPLEDDRLCDFCLRMATGGSGRTLKVYSLDEPMALPWHPNCRCKRLPHFADDTEVYTI